MLFTDSLFLFYFLPALLVLHRLAVLRRAKSYPFAGRVVLLVGTLVFYGLQASWWLIPFFLSVGFDLLWAHCLARAQSPKFRKFLLCLSIAQNLALLSLLKYSGLAVDLVESFVPYSGRFIPRIFEGNAPAGLPPGISFYTFESLSFVIDVYRGVAKPPRNPFDFFGFIAMFPRFVAGPIVRYQPMKEQFENYSGMRIEQGLYLFVCGLFLKSVFADNFGALVPLAFGQPLGITFEQAWVGSFAYMMQLYFDFSGYSMMAIGLGKCFGFDFPENFDRPYLATSLKDFWRRWHMTLSTWLRDYFYVPLGGSRHGELRTFLNLFYTFLLGGIWHGAGMTFLLWGAWHGLWLGAERLYLEKKLPPKILRVLTLFVVFVGWIFFRAENTEESWKVIEALFSLPSWSVALPGNGVTWACCLVGLIYCFSGERVHRPVILEWRHQLWGIFMMATALVCAFSRLRIPFLYYQF